MTSLLSIREGESGAHKPKKDSTSSKALLFEKVREAETRLVFSGSDAVEESLVIIGPHGLNPKVKRLVLKSYCLTVLGYKTGKFNRQWPLEDIVRVKRHAINHNCFTITCLERKKKKIKNQKYSFEVKSEIECWRWIEVLTAATTAVLKEQSKSPDAPKDTHHLSPSDSGTLKRSRSTSAPPLMAPPGVLRAQQHNHHPAGGKGLAETDDDDEEENDPYADQTDEDDEDDRLHHQHGGGLKEKEAEPYGRKTITSVSFAHMPAESRDSWASFQPAAITVSPPGTPMKNASFAAAPAAATFNPFGPASAQQQQQQQQATQGGSPYSAHQQQVYQQHMHQQSMMQPLQPQVHAAQQQAPSPYSAHQQQQQQASHYQSPGTQGVASPPSSLHTSPPSSGAAAQQQQYKPAEAPKSAPSVYITTMSPPSHMRIVQDLGLISATGTAAAPSSPNQCGAQVEAALQAARQELSLRAASRGANGVFQTSFSTAFHQWGVTVLACGTACVATMVTN